MKLTKELKETITHEVLYRYDNLEIAKDSAKTLIKEIEREVNQKFREYCKNEKDDLTGYGVFKQQ